MRLLEIALAIRRARMGFGYAVRHTIRPPYRTGRLITVVSVADSNNLVYHKIAYAIRRFRLGLAYKVRPLFRRVAVVSVADSLNSQ